MISRSKLLVACTGSVASIKLSELLATLSATSLYDIQVVLTKAVILLRLSHVISSVFEQIEEHYPIHVDEDEWNWKERGDSVLHIELRKWADIILIAPLSANTMAKIAHGLCDNLLSLIVRCWNFKRNLQGKLQNPIVVCPAMNTLMWENPITTTQLGVIKSMGIQVLGPVQKVLMCGQMGNGAMQQVKKITEYMVTLHKARSSSF